MHATERWRQGDRRTRSTHISRSNTPVDVGRALSQELKCGSIVE